MAWPGLIPQVIIGSSRKRETAQQQDCTNSSTRFGKPYLRLQGVDKILMFATTILKVVCSGMLVEVGKALSTVVFAMDRVQL